MYISQSPPTSCLNPIKIVKKIKKIIFIIFFNCVSKVIELKENNDIKKNIIK